MCFKKVADITLAFVEFFMNLVPPAKAVKMFKAGKITHQPINVLLYIISLKYSILYFQQRGLLQLKGQQQQQQLGQTHL